MAALFKFPNVIDPDKCLLEDFEIIAFEKAEDADLYTYWHDQFRGRNLVEPTKQKQTKDRPSRAVAQQNGTRPAAAATATTAVKSPDRVAIPVPETSSATRSPSKSASKRPTKSTAIPLPSSAITPSTHANKIKSNIVQATAVPENYVARTRPTEPGNGLAIINSHHYRTMPSGKVMAKYKLTKFYNKLRGRQMRRNLVLDRQKAKRLDEVMSKCQLNTWLAYTSLQALHVPGENPNQLSTIAINNNPRLISIPQSQMQGVVANKKRKKKSGSSQQSAPAQAPNRGPPVHFVYIDPNDIVTYSNRICPQQITEYRKRSHLLPSTASSKRSSAASYDVFEIMDVLANSVKTNVSITRNANKPAPAGCSIYSHSTNYNTRGIVSTQLHLQAISYLESVGKLYAEEKVRLAQEAEKMRNEPTLMSQISKYIKIDHSYSSSANSSQMDSQESSTTPDYLMVYSDTYDQEEDVIEKLEQDILSIVRPDESNNCEDTVVP